jgi:hypothetical protein
MKRSFAALLLAFFSAPLLAQQAPKHSATEAIQAAVVELKRHGKKDTEYWVEMVRFDHKKAEWVVHFAHTQLVLDTDITVVLSDKTWKACYTFGIDLPECA